MKFRIYWAGMLALARLFDAQASPSEGANPANSTADARGRTFEVRGYRIEGNTVLPPEKFGMLTNYTGRAVDLPRLRQGLSELQLLYRDLGFATISVTLPQQRLTNGYVSVRIVEGKLSRINVQGNRYFSSNNVLRNLPSLETNVLLNTKWLQPELDRANENPDRQIYPVISPGLDPGTTELTLKVKDRLPLHGHVEVNDKSTPNTPLLRVDTAVQYNNLWQLEHQIGLQYNFSPQEYKIDHYHPNILDQPMVASYSGFYLIPLRFGPSLRETSDQMPVDFGYDQITHQFRLPPPTGQPEVIFIASRSASDTPALFGPRTAITNTPLEDLSAQFASRNLGFNNDLGMRLTLPVPDFAGVHSSFSLGLDYKSYYAASFSTNFVFASLFTNDAAGNRVFYATRVATNGSSSQAKLHYTPVSLGWSATRPDSSGATSFSWSQNFFLGGLGSARTNFQGVAGSRDAGGTFTTTTLDMGREQKLPGDWSVSLRAAGQWSSAPLISNEQFELGGTGGARGYREGEAYGDTGWRAQLDLRAPAINVGYYPNTPEDIPAYLRCSWFMDYGEVYSLASSAVPSVRQWGTGFGFYYTVGQHVDARVSLAWALRDTPTTRAGDATAYFTVGVQF